MASIKKYRGSTWRAIIRRVGHPSQSQTFDSKREAESWASRVESKMGVSEFDRLQVKESGAMKVKDVFERYRDEVACHKKGATELPNVKRLLRDAEFMNILVSKLRSTDIRDWRDSRVQEIQKQSVHRELNTISGVFTHAIKEWNIPLTINPCHGVSRYKGADVQRDFMWSKDDVALLLKTSNWREDVKPKTCRQLIGWAVLIALETAMRFGEVCFPTVADFHPEPENRYLFLSDTKNGTSRKVPLSDKAIGYLTFLCQGKKPTDKIFPHNPKSYGNDLLTVRKLCGLEKLVFHDTRHTAATLMSAKLPNVLELSAVTGHLSLASLKRYYHPDPASIAAKLN